MSDFRYKMNPIAFGRCNHELYVVEKFDVEDIIKGVANTILDTCTLPDNTRQGILDAFMITKFVKDEIKTITVTTMVCTKCETICWELDQYKDYVLLKITADLHKLVRFTLGKIRANEIYKKYKEENPNVATD